VFTDGKQFVTPTTYLLPGTMRASLLASGDIIEAPISVDDIKKYTHITLINAMLPLHTMPLIPIENIK
jgi:4-amino-4-deoxychorismate lyase